MQKLCVNMLNDSRYIALITVLDYEILVSKYLKQLSFEASPNKPEHVLVNLALKTGIDKYIVIVDRAAHRVGVFKGSKYNWADAKYYKCCVGKPSTPTISGTYYIKSRGKYFDTGTKGRCWYFTQINGNYLFHSVIYDRQNSPKRIIDNSMDAAVSHGCVRLDLENAKWIYDNIPKNTKVIIY